MPTAAAKAKNKPYITVDAMTENIRKVAMAGVGVVAVAGDQVRTQYKSVWGTIDKLADRGEDAQTKSRKTLRDFLKRRSGDVKKGAKNVSSKFEGRISDVLGKLNVPTKSDITELTRRIDSLTRKIDKL